VRQIQLSAGTIEYSDTGGDRPVLVLLHGLMMDASLWDGPMADLSADHRCVAPTLPLGAHRHAMRAGADLPLPGIARLAAEFLGRLNTVQQANPARISITRRAREYIPGLAGRRNGGAEDVPRSSTTTSTARTPSAATTAPYAQRPDTGQEPAQKRLIMTTPAARVTGLLTR
jgi:hypothetical protein